MIIPGLFPFAYCPMNFPQVVKLGEVFGCENTVFQGAGPIILLESGCIPRNQYAVIAALDANGTTLNISDRMKWIRPLAAQIRMAACISVHGFSPFF